MKADKYIIFWAVFFLPFMSQVPILEETSLGVVIRFLAIALLVILAFTRTTFIAANSRSVDFYIFFYMLLVGLVSALSGLAYGFSSEPIMAIKFYVLQGLIYFLALSLRTLNSIEKFLSLYYKVCLIAAIQSILAITMEYLGLRHIADYSLLISQEGVQYNLNWYGLLGGDVGNGRTNFYFSESTHYAHFLFPGIIYALIKARYAALGVLIAGFASTFAAAASLALFSFLTMWILRHFDIRTSVITIAFLLLSFWLTSVYANMDQDFFVRLTNRDLSIADKLFTLQYAYEAIQERPFGVGVFDTADYFGYRLNTSSGLFRWIIWFGVLGIPVLLFILSALVVINLKSGKHLRLAGLSLGVAFMIGATISHGPMPKYFMIFFLGIVVRWNRIVSETRIKDKFQSSVTSSFKASASQTS